MRQLQHLPRHLARTRRFSLRWKSGCIGHFCPVHSTRGLVEQVQTHFEGKMRGIPQQKQTGGRNLLAPQQGRGEPVAKRARAHATSVPGCAGSSRPETSQVSLTPASCRLPRAARVPPEGPGAAPRGAAIAEGPDRPAQVRGLRWAATEPVPASAGRNP